MQKKEDVMNNDVVKGNVMLLLTVALIMISGEPVHITTSSTLIGIARGAKMMGREVKGF